MKRLYLIRHAKSSWSSPANRDFERPLSDTGRADAPRMAAYLHAVSFKPDMMVSSDAVRARQTADLIADGIGFDPANICLDNRLYLAELNLMQAVMRNFSDDWNTVGVIGHNPTLTDCANALANDDLENIPTCGVYGIEMEIETWSQLRSGVGKRLLFQVPKKLN